MAEMPASPAPPELQPPDPNPTSHFSFPPLQSLGRVPQEVLKSPTPANPQTANNPFSYKRVLEQGSSAPHPMDSEDTTLGEDAVIVGRRGTKKALDISDSFRQHINSPWTQTVVVNLLGRGIGYVHLCSSLKYLWKPNGTMKVVDLEQGYFMVKFSVESRPYRRPLDHLGTLLISGKEMDLLLPHH
ncbi:unnamed protein product [Linum tenue]|uniref:DUF4283 domain-containing protein n=1 Tax=Linum tenue TaxID=586396 RepID=A0AAV0RP96_9ROSI|nr:unnamed protein product [Linum tenue]